MAAARFLLPSRLLGCAVRCKSPRVRTAVRSTPLHAMQSRNDRVKLLLLKLRLYRTVLMLSGVNQRKNT